MSAPAPSSSAAASAAAAAAAAASSGSKRTFPDAATSGRRVQTRHSHSGSHPVAAETAQMSETAAAAIGHEAQTNAAASPAPGTAPAQRLYRHALESIFASLDLGGLAAALRVSRDWLAAVQSMGALHFSVVTPTAPLDVVASSAMGRHVGALGESYCHVTLSVHALSILALRMAHLRCLVCILSPPLSTAPVLLAFPAALRELHILLSADSGTADANAVLRAFGRLPLLEELTLRTHTPRVDPLLSFAPLAALSQLRSFSVGRKATRAELSDAQVDELRALTGLRRLLLPMTTELLRRLLRPPHSLQWQELPLPRPLDDQAAAMLPQLPSLTKLDSLPTICARFEWLRGLPNLTHVALAQRGAVAADGDSLAAGLQHCPHITHLQLCAYRELTAAHLADLLPRLPRLRDLRLGDLSIASLSFVAQEPMASQLAKLCLSGCRRLPPAELRRVHSLCGLQSLTFQNCFTTPLDEEAQRQYRPPSRLLPQLQTFDYWRSGS